MTTQAPEALRWMSHKEVDAALAIVDEVADAFPGFERSDTAALPSLQSKAFQAHPGVDRCGASVASGNNEKELVRREKAREKERRRYYRNKVRQYCLHAHS
jgi:hypothetical protein